MISKSNKSANIEENCDPLLNLVIASEVEGFDPITLLKLAESARLLSEDLLEAVKPIVNRDILEGFPISSLAMVASVKSTLARKQYFVESSDNDVCGSKDRLVCFINGN